MSTNFTLDSIREWSTSQSTKPNDVETATGTSERALKQSKSTYSSHISLWIDSFDIPIPKTAISLFVFSSGSLLYHNHRLKYPSNSRRHRATARTNCNGKKFKHPGKPLDHPWYRPLMERPKRLPPILIQALAIASDWRLSWVTNRRDHPGPKWLLIRNK